MQDTPTSKEAVVLKLLAEGDTMLCLDARHQDVHVPPQHANNHALRLILNLNFPHPIDVTAEGVSAHLSFGGRRFACYIPMAAVWAAFHPDHAGDDVARQHASRSESRSCCTAAARGTTAINHTVTARHPTSSTGKNAEVTGPSAACGWGQQEKHGRR